MSHEWIGATPEFIEVAFPHCGDAVFRNYTDGGKSGWFFEDIFFVKS